MDGSTCMEGLMDSTAPGYRIGYVYNSIRNRLPIPRYSFNTDSLIVAPPTRSLHFLICWQWVAKNSDRRRVILTTARPRRALDAGIALPTTRSEAKEKREFYTPNFADNSSCFVTTPHQFLFTAR